jgi:cation diffusion facilitator CzcD-associated flavoprotein CzcO
MRQTSVLIVGGGPAGLSAAGALKTVGLEPVILDREQRIGASWSQRYDRLHLHTVSRFSGLAHYPVPKHYPKYPSKDEYADYLQSYAKHFVLHVEGNTRVASIRRNGIAGNQSGFIVETDNGTWTCSNVVLATGKFREPAIPAFPDLDLYRGTALHASSYRTARAYAGKRVLVVGLGNTGAEIAADLVEQGAAAVAVSVRTMPTIVPRDVLGRPIQETGILMSRLPPKVADGIGKIVARFTVGDLRRYGIGPAQWTPFVSNRPPVIDVGFLRQLRANRIQVRPDIGRFVPDGVVFVDGREQTFDAVIFATGFTTGLETILGVPGVLDGTGNPQFGSSTSPPLPGLYFIGFRQSNRGLLYEIEIDSRRLAATIAGRKAAIGALRT